MFIKLLTLFTISLGLVVLSEFIINRNNPLTFEVGESYLKKAIKSARLGNNLSFIFWLNLLMILLIILYNI
ncbi:hypothetical protein [Anaerobranca gottschalkii]|uniref:hypothetical protein n=1 Tax=Anaerobranca gottschalkii TaxID=108328 RepID=UPI000B830C50|nr:hypothetical protein [Anaerobranca gottschalkii]